MVRWGGDTRLVWTMITVDAFGAMWEGDALGQTSLPPPQSADEAVSRNLSAAAFRVIRVILSVLMLVGAGFAAWVLARQYDEIARQSSGMPHLALGGVIALEALATLGFLLVAAIIVWRRAHDRMAIFVAVMLTAFGVALPGTCYALATTRPIWSVPGGALQALGWMLLVPFACLFPDGRLIPAWSRYLLPVWVVWVIAFFAGAGAVTQATPVVFALTFLVWAGGLGAGVLAQVYRYRAVSTFAQQQQTKWVVLGFALAIPGLGVAVGPHIAGLMLGHPLVEGAAFQFASLALFCVSALLLPGALGIAILRHQLYDVDAVINRALVYGLLTALLALTYGGSIVLLQMLAQALTGRPSDAVIVVSTLGSVVLFQPLRQRVRRAIAARFYRQEYDAAQTVAKFGEVLRHELDLQTLADELVGVVEATLRPTHISLWLRRHEDEAAPQTGERTPRES